MGKASGCGSLPPCSVLLGDREAMRCYHILVFTLGYRTATPSGQTFFLVVFCLGMVGLEKVYSIC